MQKNYFRGALCRIKNLSIVEPYFNYCCEVGNVLGDTQSTRLQKLHNRAAVIIANLLNEASQDCFKFTGVGTTKTTAGEGESENYV